MHQIFETIRKMVNMKYIEILTAGILGLGYLFLEICALKKATNERNQDTRARDKKLEEDKKFEEDEKRYKELLNEFKKKELEAISGLIENASLFSQNLRFDQALCYIEMALILSSDFENERKQIEEYFTIVQAEKEAVACNSQGDKFFKKGIYDKSYQKYEEACCKTKISLNVELYETNKHKALLAKEALELLKMEQFEEGIIKYIECSTTRGKNFWLNFRLFKFFLPAMIRCCVKHSEFDEAFEVLSLCNSNKSFKKFKKVLKKVYNYLLDEHDAMLLNSQGDDFLKQRKYDEAFKKYNRACKRSKEKSKIKNYKTNRKNAKMYLKHLQEFEQICKNFENYTNECADRRYKQGLNFWNNGLYQAAFNKFNFALNACSNDYMDKALIENDMKKAQMEIKAMELNSQGNELFELFNYSAAFEKYNEACEKSKVETNCRVYKSNRDKAMEKLKTDQADLLEQEGIELQNREKFKEAYNKFNKAFQLCAQGHRKKRRLETYTVIAKSNWAKQLNKQGDYLFINEDFDSLQCEIRVVAASEDFDSIEAIPEEEEEFGFEIIDKQNFE